MKVENVLTPPNSFLKAYRARTFAIAAGDWFVFEQYRVNLVYEPSDYTFSSFYPFYGSEVAATNNGDDPASLGICTLKLSTKKALIRFHKHPNAAATDFLANYSVGPDLFLPTFIGARPDPFNAMAKDGDEIEIYGYSEIQKFFCGPLNSAFTQVPYLLTVILFE
jgi:hypothetical protein